MKNKLLVLTGDIHAGGTVSLMPPGFVTTEGQEIGQNAIQKWLWHCWTDAWSWVGGVVGNDKWDLVLNGDLTEGVHHKTTQVISPDFGDHISCAIELLAPVCADASRVFVIRGTECHTGNAEVAIGRALGAEIDFDSKLPAFDRLHFKMHGIAGVVRHHFPTATRPYLESGQYSIQMGAEIIEAVRNKEDPPRILICAHRHRAGHFQDGHSLTMVTAPWQALTRYGHKVVSQARTKPGIFILDWRDKAEGELPEIHFRMYEAPAQKTISL